jgi:hypothetical protein
MNRKQRPLPASKRGTQDQAAAFAMAKAAKYRFRSEADRYQVIKGWLQNSQGMAAEFAAAAAAAFAPAAAAASWQVVCRVCGGSPCRRHRNVAKLTSEISSSPRVIS